MEGEVVGSSLVGSQYVTVGNAVVLAPVGEDRDGQRYCGGSAGDQMEVDSSPETWQHGNLYSE